MQQFSSLSPVLMAPLGSFFLILASLAAVLLWGVSLWNGTVAELFAAVLRGHFEDGTPLRTRYTGIFLVDFPVSLLVAFFFYGTNGSDPGYQLFLIDAYSTLQPAFVWLYVESARMESKPFLIANPVVWGLLWQAFGGAISLPLYFYHHLEWKRSRKSLPSPGEHAQLRAVPLSFIIGAVLPAVVGMLPMWMERSASTHQWVLAAWQPDPVWVSLVQHAAVAVLRCWGRLRSSSSSAPRTGVRRNALLGGSAAMAYLTAALSSAIGHVYVVARVLASNDCLVAFGRIHKQYIEINEGESFYLFFLEHAYLELFTTPCAEQTIDLLLGNGKEKVSIRRLSVGDPGPLGPCWTPSRDGELDTFAMATSYDVAIIGAGWYGLVAARTWLRLRPDANLIILDSDSTVGGVWSRDRLYPNLVAQVKLGLFNYTDTPMPPDGATANGLVTGPMIHGYLQRYAEEHDLLRRIRFNTFVERAEPCAHGGWRLSLRDAPGEAVETEKLMVATGVTSIPNLPDCDRGAATVPIIHSRDIGVSYDALNAAAVRRVTVVGAAKSAYDAVYLLVSMGKEVDWIIRPDGAGPLAILPAELFGVFNSIAVASTRLMTCLSPSVFNTTGPVYRFFQRTSVGRWVTGKFWDVVTSLSDSHAGYSQGDHVSRLRPEVDGKSVFWANSGLGVVTLPDFWRRLHSGKINVIRDNLDRIEEDQIVLKSGKKVAADFAVMCTGWGDHFAMFDDATKLQVGLPLFGPAKSRPPADAEWDKLDREAGRAVDAKLPFIASPPGLKNAHTNQVQPNRRWRLYRRVVPLSHAVRGDRSLAILGQIHTVQTPLVAEVQSFWAILYLLGELELPDEDTMAREIAEWNAWTRKRYLSQGQKFPYSLYDFLPASIARSPRGF
ncbi:flavin-binding monooxygenase-like family protein [Diplodia corticola]|uniref:Flavin-binding monooxygenase-like family protein n=1 Tax=Diplodia corticola TaxID=236234 RepID=A0A1J9QR83_9PEZI|nr:flavin-binding monooxygenase-like family protein [Diplodia corticola]OJD30960.1 flavin-binding monooxygenase-like family protein [Diplodia corticola]